MPRQMKPISLAIRKLLDKHGEALTHTEAAPMLAEIGKKEDFEVADNGPSEEFTKMMEYEINWDDDASVQSVANACGFDAAAVKRARKYRAWKLQENTFNVAKNSWRKEQSGAVSTRPKQSRNVRATAAKKEQKKRGRPPKVVHTNGRKRGRPTKIAMPSMDDLDEIAALKYVESNGGLPAVQDMLTKAQAEAAYLSRVLELYNNLGSRYKASESGKVAKTSAA